jgi:hypothetical protein
LASKNAIQTRIDSSRYKKPKFGFIINSPDKLDENRAAGKLKLLIMAFFLKSG